MIFPYVPWVDVAVCSLINMTDWQGVKLNSTASWNLISEQFAYSQKSQCLEFL